MKKLLLSLAFLVGCTPCLAEEKFETKGIIFLFVKDGCYKEARAAVASMGIRRPNVQVRIFDLKKDKKELEQLGAPKVPMLTIVTNRYESVNIRNLKDSNRLLHVMEFITK